MIRIAAVDDERHILERFERMIVDVKECELCGLFDSGEALLVYLREHSLDAVFLDIEMPGINGLELSEQIMDLNKDIDIIFATAYNQYAVEAFELQVIDYIVKPLTLERLDKTIKRLLRPKRSAKRDSKPMIQCFDDFEVFINGKAIAFRNSKAKEILAFMVHQKGVSVNWEKIAAAVWPEYNSEKAHTNLHATTYLLRKQLNEVGLSQILESGRGQYRLVTEEVHCDFYQLEALIKSDKMNRRSDTLLVEKVINRGYMEGNGFEWAQPRAAEIDGICRRIIENQ